MSSIPCAAAWEAIYAPYDQGTYRAVLDLLKPDDVILDIGAGDLRLSRKMALVCHKVYAVEINASVLSLGLGSTDPMPGNLIPTCADARTFAFPSDVTVGVLMMRHCTHFRLYFDKLQNAAAQRLITNVRWRMGVEQIDLRTDRIPFPQAGMGWYACQCGGAGFKEGPAEQWTAEMDGLIHEVEHCPQCRQNRNHLELL